MPASPQINVTVEDVADFQAAPTTINARFCLRLFRCLDDWTKSTQADIADYLGVPVKTYRSWENGSNDFDVSPAKGPVLQALMGRFRWLRSQYPRIFFTRLSGADAALALEFVSYVDAVDKKMGIQGNALALAEAVKATNTVDLWQLLQACYAMPKA